MAVANRPAAQIRTLRRGGGPASQGRRSPAWLWCSAPLYLAFASGCSPSAQPLGDLLPVSTAMVNQVQTASGDTTIAPSTASASAERTPASQPASQPTSQPATRPAYTTPSLAVQRLALTAALGHVELAPELAGAGKEVSESVSLSAGGAIGRTGLAAPSTTIGTSVVSRSALQGGQLVGVGFASPNNLFTAGANPLSGPNGRCAELAGAGFFGGNSAICEAGFRGGRSAVRR